MILTQDLEFAYNTPAIGEIEPQRLRNELKEAIIEYAVRIGQAGLKEPFVETTTAFLVEDLKKYYKYLKIGEVILTIRLLGKGVLGETRHVSVSTFSEVIKLYLDLPLRIKFKEEKAKEENAGALKLTQKAGWTEEEKIEKMRERYRENLQRVRNGAGVKDVGGLLWETLLEKGFVDPFKILPYAEYTKLKGESQEPEAEFIESVEMYEELVEKLKANSFDSYTRGLVKAYRAGDNSVIIPFVQERIMKRYFQMEIEARDIKSKTA